MIYSSPGLLNMADIEPQEASLEIVCEEEKEDQQCPTPKQT